MTIFWIAAIIVTAIASSAITVRIMNRPKPEPTVLQKISENPDQWSKGFDDGWNAALSDFGMVYRTYKRMTSDDPQDN